MVLGPKPPSTLLVSLGRQVRSPAQVIARRSTYWYRSIYRLPTTVSRVNEFLQTAEITFEMPSGSGS